MFKKLIFLSTCLFLPLPGAIPQGENIQIGRYQMIQGKGHDGDRELYLLDTATGRVWKSIAKKNWIEHDAWTPKIATSPDNH